MISGAFAGFRSRQFGKSNQGAVATEYALVIAFISLVSAAGMSVLGSNLSSFYDTIGGAIANISCEMPDNASDTGKSKSQRCK